MSKSSPSLTRVAAFDFDVVSDVRPIPSRKPDPMPDAAPRIAEPEKKMAEPSGGR